MNKRVWIINILNLKNIPAPYIVTGAVFLIMLLQDVAKAVVASRGLDMRGQLLISIGDYLWLLIPLAAIFIAIECFKRIVNLGGKRRSFLVGSLVTYTILSGIVSAASTLIYYTYDRIMINTGYFEGVINLIEVFNWNTHGLVGIFLQQFAFLFLLAAFTHTFTAMQDSWIGWLTDLVIVTVISVFTPIASLRALEVKFFNLIIFQSNPLIQIFACLILGVVIYSLSLPVFNRKTI